NEDACGHWRSERHLCCVMADGAGGHGGGDVASKLVVRQVLTDFMAAAADTPQRLHDLLVEANRNVRRHSTPGTVQAHMHTTAVVLVIDFIERRALWAHAGDSRLYRFSGDRIEARTSDHSLVQSLVDAGMLAEADLRTHPKRSELRSALGIEEDELEIGVTAAAIDVLPGDVFLLCTDGLWEHIESAAMEQLLARAPTPVDWLAALATEVRRNTVSRPKHDNYSALAVWVTEDGPPA
ncbi:MAG: phosphoprotein phosphatase, partial [Rhizobacter sp.]|nr:phosphoprotein phosphatase [Rhizobacter sp.]